MERIVSELEAKREQAGASVEDFANTLGISAATYSRVRRGLYPPSSKLIKGALRRYPELTTALEREAQDGAA